MMVTPTRPPRSLECCHHRQCRGRGTGRGGPTHPGPRGTHGYRAVSKGGSGLFLHLPPVQPPWQLLCAISWWWGPRSVAPSEPQGGGDGPRLWLGPGQAAAEGAAWVGMVAPKPAGVPHGAPIPHPGAPCQELCLPGTPSPACPGPYLPAPLCCLPGIPACGATILLMTCPSPPSSGGTG